MKLGLFSIGISVLFSSAVLADDETSVVNMAKESGVKRCIPNLKHISDFILDGKAHGTHSTWNQNAPDNRMYSSMSSKSYTDGNSHVSVVAAINSEGKCDTYYMETFALPNSCMKSRETTYKEMKYIGTLDDKTIVLENAGGANYYLTPQGTQNKMCLVSKRETVYD